MGGARSANARCRTRCTLSGARAALRRALSLAGRAQFRAAQPGAGARPHFPVAPSCAHRARLRLLPVEPMDLPVTNPAAAPETSPMGASSPVSVPAPTTWEEDPLWYKDAIVYELHVKAFFDSNNDGMGDFRGLTDK